MADAVAAIANAAVAAGTGLAAGGPIGGLVGLGISLAPEIGRWLFGSSQAEKVGEAVSRAVEAVAGTSDPEAARNVLAADPEAVMRLRVELARIAAEADRAERQMELEEIKNARGTMLELARRNHPLAYGAAVVTAVVLGLFGYVIVAGGDVPLALKETLKTIATAAVFYWVGSSPGSAAKDVPRGNLG